MRAVPPARVPDRPPLHDARRGRPGRVRGAGAARGMSPTRGARPSSSTATARCRTRWATSTTRRASVSTRGRWTRCAPINRAGWLAVRGHQPGRRRARLLPGVGGRRGAGAAARGHRGGRRALRRASTPACTTPPSGEPPYRTDCDCRKPRPGLLRRAEARARRRPLALVGGRRPPRRPAAGVERGRARRAREDRLRPRRAELPRAGLVAPAGPRGREPAGGGRADPRAGTSDREGRAAAGGAGARFRGPAGAGRWPTSWPTSSSTAGSSASAARRRC